MKRNEIIAGLDIGTSFIRTVVARPVENENGGVSLEVMGLAKVVSAGIQRGVVKDVEEAVASINSALESAETMAGVTIENVAASISGTHIGVKSNRGVVAVSRSDSEITKEDVNRAVSMAQTMQIPSNREILHVIPTEYTVDDQPGITDPIGISGLRLEVDVQIIDGSAPFIRNLMKCIHQAGATVDTLIFTPLAAAKAVLTKRQRDLGVVLVDMGAGTTSIAVFEDNKRIHAMSLPLGSMHVTNDVAVGLRSSIDVAEKIKLDYGTVLYQDINPSQQINLKSIDPAEPDEPVSRKEIAEIIEARVSEIFSLINKELRAIGKYQLPAGVVLTGGGAKIQGAVDLVKREMRLPAQLGYPQELLGPFEDVNDPEWAVAIGLVMNEMEERQGGNRRQSGQIQPAVGKTIEKMRGWFKQLLP